jgi:hypothetical protein
MPRSASASVASVGAYSVASMPLWMTWMRSCATSNRRSTSARVPRLTATTASAISSAVRSTQVETSYPPPSCSRFHGLSGSSEWTVMTSGMP